jgi:hypothetical protein
VAASGLKPEGFVHDDSRMPDKAVDIGTAVIAGSVWDGDNRAAETRFNIAEASGKLTDSISGTLELSDYKSHMVPGLALFQAGIGDNADCQLSGIELVNANTWHPIVEPGIFFDLETQLYLHSSGSTEMVVTGTDLRTTLAVEPQPPHPITLSTFFMDKWGKAHAYEQFAHKVRFTGVSGLNTHQTVPNSSPPLYRPAYSGIRWYNVDTTKFEFMVDHTVPEVIRSRNITSGVHAVLRKVPYARNQYQLPLVPVASVSGTPTVKVFSELLAFSDTGLATPALSGLGTFSSLVVTSGGYVRLSGTLQPSGNFIPTLADVSTWPSVGTILVDDMIDQRTEQIDYLTASASGFWASGVRLSGTQHRSESQIRLVLSGYDADGNAGFSISGILASGFQISGTTYTGDHYAQYEVLMTSVPTYNQWNGLMTVSGTESLVRADVDLTYYRGIGLCYEPSGLLEYNSRPALNVNPLVQGNVDGMVWFSTFPLKADQISVAASKNKDIDNFVGPVYAGNDFLTLTATVKDRFGAPVPNETVSVSLDNVQSIGKIDGAAPLDEVVEKTTNSRGEARFVYTPPETIHGLGYFTQFSNIVGGSGLQFAQTFELNELYVSGVWNTRTFAVWNDDEYDTWSEISGALQYTADGRFEIIAAISAAGDSDTYATFAPIEPTAALDSAGNILSTSGQVKTLVYTSGQLPTAETAIGAFFVSAEKQVTVGVVAPDSNATSKTLKMKVGIPEFMKGELYFGPLEDVDTRSLDSLAYLTINPYTMDFIDEHRFDPRQLGNVFRIQGSKSDLYLRNKFYITPDWFNLNALPNNQEVRKQFSFRNRFILEII